jgi:hypothetical protein
MALNLIAAVANTKYVATSYLSAVSQVWRNARKANAHRAGTGRSRARQQSVFPSHRNVEKITEDSCARVKDSAGNML